MTTRVLEHAQKVLTRSHDVQVLCIDTTTNERGEVQISSGTPKTSVKHERLLKNYLFYGNFVDSQSELFLTLMDACLLICLFVSKRAKLTVRA